MSHPEFSRVTATLATQVFPNVMFHNRKLRKAKAEGFAEFAEMAPLAFFNHLVEQEMYTDAIRFLAHSLPKRDAIWWLSLCLWSISRPEPTELVAQSLDATLQWLRDPNEDNRRAAERIGRINRLHSPECCLAMAVFWSGGSMSKVGYPMVRPPDYLTARVVGGGIVLASVVGQKAEGRRRRRLEFLALGREVASGQNLWVEGAPMEATVAAAPVEKSRHGQRTFGPSTVPPSSNAPVPGQSRFDATKPAGPGMPIHQGEKEPREEIASSATGKSGGLLLP